MAQNGPIRVLMVSTDPNILVSGSAVSERMRGYASLVGELHIVVLSKPGFASKIAIAPNCFAYPTNSKSKFFRPLDAMIVGEKIDCDLITTQDPFECGWVGVNLKRAKRVPLEVQLHTNPFSKEFGGILNLIRKYMMGRNFKEASGIRVVLDSVGEEVKKRYGVENVYTLPIFVDQRRIMGEPKFDLHKKYGFKFVSLMVSRLTEEKDIGLALDAFKIVRKTNKNVGLVIVGSGPKKFEEQEGVVFVGWEEDLASYYKTADVFIQTSKFEGYGLSLVEAGLCGLSVITTPVGIATELKSLTLANTVDEFTAAMLEALDNPKRGLKEELETKILKKEEYLDKLKNNWFNLLQK